MYEPNDNSVENDNDDSISNEFTNKNKSVQIHPLIVNGKDAEIREFPCKLELVRCYL